MGLFINGQQIDGVLNKIVNLTKSPVIEENTNLNEISSGIFKTNGSKNNYLPKKANPYGILSAVAIDNFNFWQIYLAADNKLYLRTHSGKFSNTGNWSSWKEIGGVLSKLKTAMYRLFNKEVIA